MREVIIGKIMNVISKNYNYDNTKLNEIKYGLETIYLTITKTIVIIIISLLIGTLKELLLFMILYSIIKSCGFGLHAKKSWHCWVFSLSLFSLIPYLIKILTIEYKYMLLAFVICTILFLIYAPADTEKRPLINKKKRTIYKILTLIISVIYTIVAKYTNNIISNSLMFACLMQALIILPISYKVLGLKYNNYKSYKKGGIK